MKKTRQRLLASLLTGAMMLSMCGGALAAEPEGQTPKEAPAASAITSIQATAVANFYGYKVGAVDITYPEGTDLSGVTEDCYTLYDRGFLNPEFGKVEVTSAEVDGNVVTLYVDQGSDKVTDRSRETYGTLCTSSSWYVDSEGKIHYGAEVTTDALGITIYPNTIKKGLQWRKNMDLVLCVNSDDITKGIRSTDGAGNMLDDTVWEDTILSDDLDEVELEMVDVGWKAPNFTMLGDEGKVPVQVIYPEGYDVNRAEPYPVIVYQCGGGVCYWEVTDDSTTAANNLGCNVVYDVMMTEWHRQMPEAIIMSVNVHSSTIDNSAKEIAGVLDYSIENWNVDKDRIIIVGNSQGTLIASDVIRQRPDLIAAFVECNGNFGGMATEDQLKNFDGSWKQTSLTAWTEDEVQAVIDNDISLWMFNGETDGTNPGSQQDVIEAMKALYREAGKSEEWIDLHVRASGLQSWKFKQWGETDHSVTKVVAWNYLAQPYMDVWENEEPLEAGDTYTYTGAEEGYKYYEYTKDYEYTVYPESVAQWAKKVFASVGESPVDRADAAEKIYEYFNWSHRDEYNDIWAPDMVHFDDVAEGSDNWMAIECLLQQGVVDKTAKFRPTEDLTYAEAIDMLSRAFGVAKDDVAALMTKGYDEKTAISTEEWNTAFESMTENYVSPVQALPIANSEAIAPRRYIKLWTPTEGATIYVSKSVSLDGYYEDFDLDIENAVENVNGWSSASFDSDGDKVDDLTYVTKPTQIYTVDEDGYIKEDYGNYANAYVTYKVVAVDAEGNQSAVKTYKWHLQRPINDTFSDEARDYQHTLIRKGTATSPTVYQICRDAETLRPMAWYVEGSEGGIVIDALFTQASSEWNLKEYVDEHLATKPYVLVVGHAHPDHDMQVANFVDAEIPTYCNDRGWSSLKGLIPADSQQALVKNIDEGDSFNLGNCTFDVYALPGHHDSLVMLADRANGLVFATDIYGCTRAGSADNVNVAGIPADLLLSLAQQTHADYEREGTQVVEVYTGHDELPLDHNVLENFEAALQQVIDNGDAATSYTLRGGNNKVHARTTMVGDMWKDGTNWLSLMLTGIKGDESAYLSDGNAAYMNSTAADTAVNSSINYNFVNGVQQYKTYSVLSNVEVEGGQLEGVDLTWKAPSTMTWASEETTVNYTLHDKFNPWHYNYIIDIEGDEGTISIDATTMSTKAKITGITLNGVAQSDLEDMAVTTGSIIKVEVTAQDGETTSTYTFCVNVANLDSYTEALPIDYTQASQLPLTGYYTKNIGTDRSVKVYIAEDASIRSYFTVVAVPDGVDTYEFLEEEGWFDLADEKGEGLFVLEPGKNGWGSAEEEANYLAEAIGFLRSGSNASKVGVFSTFGEFYLAGYGKGADALELWAAQNPILVISQVYVDGTGIASATLTEIGKAEYDGIKAGGYADIPDFEDTLAKVGMQKITKAEVPVPSWFVNYGESENIAYWKSASDVVAEAVDGSFYQDIKSDALQTEHANAEVLKLDPDAQYGISQVKVTSGVPTAADIYGFLSIYSRYENSFAYANTLAYRVDYTAARVGAQQQAAEGKAIDSFASKDYEGKDVTVELWGKADTETEKGTVQVGVFTFSDNNGDGKNDPREYLVYVPNSCEGKKAPVLMVYPGNTQTDGIFFDCTQWNQVADREGFVVVIVNETYSSAVAITHKDSLYYQTAMMTVLENVIDGQLADLDFTRVYGTGQSLGCMTTQAMARTHPEFFAAVAATSGVMEMGFGEDANEMIPTFLLTGQSDLPFLLPDLWRCDTLVDWAEYFLSANGIKATVDGYDSHELTKIHNFNRCDIYTWENKQGIPMVKWGQTLMRAHNCYAGEMDLLWDYLQHFSFVKNSDGSITRYYSASAFAEDDAVVIKKSSGSSSSSGTVTEPETKTFRDVHDVNHWAEKAVDFVVSKNLFSGTGANTFSPDVPMTRGMLAVVLHSLEGKPAASGAAELFTDVAKGSYYEEAIGWAVENGVLSGYGDGRMGPNDPVTREQLATMLWKYAKAPEAGESLSKFSDADQASGYAVSALNWAVENGIMGGRGNGVLAPAGQATRAEVAQMMMNFLEYMEK